MQGLVDYYRCPDGLVDFALAGDLSQDCGYFRFGPDAVCYGQSSSGVRARSVKPGLYDAGEDVRISGPTISLPFDPTQVIDNLRYERYVAGSLNNRKRLSATTFPKGAYYFIRRLLPVSVRKHIQRMHARGWDKVPFPSWPVDRTVERILEKLLALSLRVHGINQIPFVWFWPQGAQSCAILTHDVETLKGRDFCPSLMDLDESFGIKASFQIVPEKRYPVSPDFLRRIRERGFEINIHDLNHDGHLFEAREEFLGRARRINRYAQEYGAKGFRSGALYRNVDWYGAFDFSYDMSVPNVGHLDPQGGGCCTVMPYFINHILELPLTTTQDYSLFHILGDHSIELWKGQIDLIIEKHGLVSFVIHPDYIIENRARTTYTALLRYLSELRAEGKIWIALPGDVDAWWRERSQMNVVHENGTSRIEGPGKERARLAYAALAGDTLVYNLGQGS